MNLKNNKNKKLFPFILFIFISLFSIYGCGGGSSTSKIDDLTGFFTKVEGVEYNTSSGIHGVIDKDGSFKYKSGDKVTFSIGEAELGTIDAKEKIDVFDFKRPDLILQILHSLDLDRNPNNGFEINIKSNKGLSNNNKTSKKSNTIIKIEEIDSDTLEYKNFLEENSDNIINKNKAISESFLENLKKFAEKENIIIEAPERTGIAKIALGASYDVDKLSWINKKNEKIKERVRDLYKTNNLEYNTKLAALQTNYLSIIQKLDKDSQQAIDAQEALDKYIKEQSLLLNTIIDNTFLYVETIKKKWELDPAKKDILKKIINMGIQFGLTEYEIYGSGQGALETKLAANALVNCTNIYGETKNFRNCVIDTGEEFIGALIERNMDSGGELLYMNKETTKDLVSRGIKIFKMWENCGLKKYYRDASLECMQDVVKNGFNNIYDLTARVYQIAKIENDQNRINSFKYALEIFMAKEHLLPYKNGNNIYDDACAIIPFYPFDNKTSAEMEKLKIECYNSKDLDKLQIIIKVLSHFNDELNINSLWISNQNFQYIKDYLALLNSAEPYEKLKTSYYNYYSKLINGSETVNKEDTKNYVTSSINIDISDIKFIQKDNNKVDISIEFSYKSNIGIITNIKPTIEIYLDKQYSLILDNFKDIGKEGVITGKLENIDINNINQFIINGKLEFKLYNTINDYLYTKYISKQYSLKFIPKKENKVTINYSLNNQNYYLSAFLEDYREKKDNSYIYYWYILDCESKNLSTDKPELIYKANQQCLQVIPNVKLLVLDKETQEDIAETDINLDPVLAYEHIKILDMPEITMKSGDTINISPKIAGGELPYKINAYCEYASINIKNNVIKLSVENNSNEIINTTLKLSVFDKNRNFDTKEISIKVLPSDKIPTIKYISQNPEDGYSFNGTLVKEWIIKSNYSYPINNILLKWNENKSSSNLIHSKDDIYIDTLEPYQYKTIKLTIDTDGVEKGTHNIGWYDIYFYDENHHLKELKYDNGIPAYLSYDLYVGEAKDKYPPYIINTNINSNSGKIIGIFEVSQKNNKVKHLRVHFSPYNYFPEDNREYVDVEEGDYESIQNTGIKHFSFDASKWEGKVVYWKIEAENKDGIKQLYPAKGSVYVKEYEATKEKPVITTLKLEEETGDLKGKGYIKIETEITQKGDATLETLKAHCAINGIYDQSGAYTSKEKESPIIGTNIILIHNEAWAGKLVECKIEAINSYGLKADVKKETIKLTKEDKIEFKLEVINKDECKNSGICKLKIIVPNNNNSYSINIDWDDGSNSLLPGWDDYTTSQYDIQEAQHKYNKKGSYTIKAKVNIDNVGVFYQNLNVFIN